MENIAATPALILQTPACFPHPNGVRPIKNHKGDLWIYFASRLYDEERNEKRRTSLCCKTLVFLLPKRHHADKCIFPIHQQVEDLLRFLCLMIML